MPERLRTMMHVDTLRMRVASWGTGQLPWMLGGAR